MKKRGFTLIELLAVIVVLAIIALIATPLALNTIEESRKGAAMSSANGYIEAIENKVASSLIQNKKYEDRDDYVYDEIPIDVKGTEPTGGVYSLKNGIVTTGVFCINGYEVNYSDGKTEVQGTCTGEELKLSGSVKLSETSGYYTYPTGRTFEVIENTSGGTLSCTSSDEEIATCTIEETTVTVTPGEKEGTATLTIKAEGNSKYKDAQAAYVAYTEKGLLSYTANGYSGVYDEKAHGIVVSSENAIIKYGLEEGIYDLETSPTYTDVGEYTIYFEITKAGFNTITGSKTVVITKAEGKFELEETTGTIEYNKTNSVEIIENTSNGEITVTVANTDVVEASIVNGKLNITGKQTGTTTIILMVAETNNYNSASTEYTVTVTKANNTLTLSSNSGSYTYPTGGTFTITKNTSGGTLSCTSSNTSVATCSISGTTVTVTPGTTAGTATLTIKSAATTNYNEGQAAYVVTTANGVLSVTASNYSGTYDGAAHGITVTSSGATIKYGTSSGSYTLTSSPTYTNVGTYTVYYQVTRTGYKTVTGSKTVTISKASGSATLSATSGTVYKGKTKTFTVSGATGTLSCTSSNTSVATCSISGTTVTVTGVADGTATITVNVAASTNYNATSKTYSATSKTYSATVKTLLSDVVTLGDYVSMTPTSTSYTISAASTGYSSDQTINPSELNLWRVISINDDGTIDMVSEYVSSTNVYFKGQTGYLNFVGALNTIAKQYENSNYTVGSRYMGYNGQTETITDTSKFTNPAPWTSSTADNSNESVGGGDILYEKDTGLVTTALGTLTAYTPGTTTATAYWLGSRRYLYNSSTYCYWGGRRVYASGSVSYSRLYGYNSGWNDNSNSYALRPIVTLKSGLKVTGSGTSESPWVLS